MNQDDITRNFSWEGQRNHDRCQQLLQSPEFRARMEQQRRERMLACSERTPVQQPVTS
jgi:hypothetical protein